MFKSELGRPVLKPSQNNKCYFDWITSLFSSSTHRETILEIQNLSVYSLHLPILDKFPSWPELYTLFLELVT